MQNALNHLVERVSNAIKENDRDTLVLGAASVAAAYVSTNLLIAFILSRPEPVITKHGVEDPVGTKNGLKRAIANCMTWIAQRKEVSKSTRASPQELESWHKPENHAFFNESYYFNGCDLKTQDRFITRISRRSYNGSRSYVFLLIDSKEHGTFALEEDVPAEPSANPTALGLVYKCEVPMKRWRIKYSGPMRRKCTHPRDYEGLAYSERVHVDLDLVYETESPLFWYMRDDHPTCLANNLAQESWGMDFLRVCMKRTIDHAHYEDFGRTRGTISINRGKPTTYDFGTFRDHSWDIRRWATMDKLNILLIALEKPLKLWKDFEYWYLDLTIVDMPGNVGGVARYSTGYAVGNKPNVPKLTMTSGSSIRDFQFTVGAAGAPGGAPERRPTENSEILMRLTPHPRDLKKSDGNVEPRLVKIIMKGDPRRLIYWPDQGAFICYEDCPSFEIIDVETGTSVKGYGTRQTGFRVGEFDPSLGGCG